MDAPVETPAIPAAPPAPDFFWAEVRAEVQPGTWTSLGALVFEGKGAAREHVVVAGIINVDGNPIPPDTREKVSIWCPDVAARWLPLPEFTKATGAVQFQESAAVWAKNDADRAVEVLLRVRYLPGEVPAPAPDGTPAYYASKVWKKTTWFGTPVLKCPTDLWALQELIFELRPDLIVETGTFQGGSAAYMACLLDHLAHGEVLTIDVEKYGSRPDHERIEYLQGSSIDDDVVYHVLERAVDQKTLVVLDSDHTFDHVLAELYAYADAADYIIIEDTNTPGPAEAVRAFLEADSRFEVDTSREKFGTGFNKGGWLRRKGQ